jgi:hypothetical protein
MVPQMLLQSVAIDSDLVGICFSGVADGTRLVAASWGARFRLRRGRSRPESQAKREGEDGQERTFC